MSSENSNLWHDAMKEEIAFTDKNQVWELLNYQKELNLLVVNGSIRPKEIHLVESRGLFSNCHGIDGSFDSELHKMDVKTAFVNEDLEEELVYVYTRHDIAFEMGLLGRYQSNPGIEHWKAAKKAMHYLQGTKDLQVIYKHTENLEVVGYSNSSFVGCLDTLEDDPSHLIHADHLITFDVHKLLEVGFYQSAIIETPTDREDKPMELCCAAMKPTLEDRS
ncbi:hypothetical protein Sango_2437600 [Sesamum angolense]|uniref:Uncharacterized protein n=1 Tax=Sesamum angolense TaxID=2727404 RepID=A0AAE2BK32_9LAMI|nr:hypothetical protein Sango_2437600 [Sesamum angolense]